MRGVSFEGTNAKRTVARLRCNGRFGSRGVGRSRIVHRILQERGRRYEEQRAGPSSAEIQYPIVISGRAADEHVFQHLLSGSRRAAVANEISTKLARGGVTERHVVANDLHLLAVLDNRVQCVVRGCWLDRIIELDVG